MSITATAIGNMTEEPELAFVGEANTPVATFKLASDNRYGDGTSFPTIKVWGPRGQAAAENLSKGRLVRIDGEITEQVWEHDGQTYRRWEIRTDNWEFIGTKPKAKAE